MRTLTALALAALTLAAPAASAGPFGHGPRGGADRPADRPDDRPHNPAQAREHRMKMLRRVHTQFVVGLGDQLDLDTAATLKLSDRLQKHNEQRIQLRLDNWDAMEQLKALARGEGTGDAAALARRVAQNRVKLAEVAQRELDEVLQGLPPDKAARVALFATQFGARVERMAHKAREQRGGPGPHGAPEPGDDD